MKLREAHMKTSAAKTIGRKAIYTVLVLSALLPFVTLHRAEAGVNVWTTNGPHSETINALAIDPQTPTTLTRAPPAMVSSRAPTAAAIGAPLTRG